MNQEIEIKIKVSVEDLSRIIKELKLENQENVFERTYGFFTPDGESIKKGIFPRIKQVGNDCWLDIKIKKKEDKNYFKRDEYRLFISDISNGIEIMKIFGYTDIRIFEKFRKKIRIDNVDICLDELPFGLYVEIEGEEKMIEKAVKKLGLEKNQRIVVAYLKLADELNLRDAVFKESNKKEGRRTRRPNINLKLTALKNILKYRARGYTMESIAKIFDLGSRQEIYKIIKDNKNNPEVINLYQEVEKTQEFLNREL